MIEFTFNTDFILDNKEHISDWLLSLANSEGFTIKNLHYNYVSVEKIQSINNQFLNHDYPTDVIAFDYCEDKELSGEVFVCQQIVEQNAVSYSQTPEHETLRVFSKRWEYTPYQDLQAAIRQAGNLQPHWQHQGSDDRVRGQTCAGAW